MFCPRTCIQSTRVNFSRNPSERFNLLYLEECIKFTRLQFSWLWYSREHSGKWMHAEKTWYTVIRNMRLVRKQNNTAYSICLNRFKFQDFYQRQGKLFSTCRSVCWSVCKTKLSMSTQYLLTPVLLYKVSHRIDDPYWCSSHMVQGQTAGIYTKVYSICFDPIAWKLPNLIWWIPL